ncbi:formate dehydrogenase subunit delta [Nocardia aobensis]|uniref:Formate dehydrogenase subunit delta n=1 Tax=Nocardia aobensis TaxID=257277 RepID=A0ABW6PF55_9NOCA
MPRRQTNSPTVWPCGESRTTMGAPPAMRLATDIAAQFRHIPPDAAAADIADHIRRFWEPRLRAQLLDQVTRAGTTCDPHIAAAAGLLAGPAD